MTYYFSRRAFRLFAKLPREVQKRIITKLDWYVRQDDPLAYAEPLTDYAIGEFRFRIGDYRVIFDLDEEGDILVLLVGHRRDIYR